MTKRASRKPTTKSTKQSIQKGKKTIIREQRSPKTAPVKHRKADKGKFVDTGPRNPERKKK